MALEYINKDLEQLHSQSTVGTATGGARSHFCVKFTVKLDLRVLLGVFDRCTGGI